MHMHDQHFVNIIIVNCDRWGKYGLFSYGTVRLGTIIMTASVLSVVAGSHHG